MENNVKKIKTVKNVVSNADISRSFYFINLLAPCLSKENISLIWEVTYTTFLANSESFIFVDAVQETLWHFFQGNFKMLFIILLFKSQRCTFLIIYLNYFHCRTLILGTSNPCNTRGIFSIFLFGNLKMHP